MTLLALLIGCAPQDDTVSFTYAAPDASPDTSSDGAGMAIIPHRQMQVLAFEQEDGLPVEGAGLSLWLDDEEPELIDDDVSDGDGEGILRVAEGYWSATLYLTIEHDSYHPMLLASDALLGWQDDPETLIEVFLEWE